MSFGVLYSTLESSVQIWRQEGLSLLDRSHLTPVTAIGSNSITGIRVVDGDVAQHPRKEHGSCSIIIIDLTAYGWLVDTVECSMGAALGDMSS